MVMRSVVMFSASLMFRSSVIAFNASPLLHQPLSFVSDRVGPALDFLASAVNKKPSRTDLRTELLEAMALKQSRSSRLRVEALLELLLREQKPLSGQVSTDGLWRLRWSTQTSDANPLATPDSVLGGVCFQRISDAPRSGWGAKKIARAENIVQWKVLSEPVRLIGGASLERQG